jgi:hypothetical protein
MLGGAQQAAAKHHHPPAQYAARTIVICFAPEIATFWGTTIGGWRELFVSRRAAHGRTLW